MLGFGSLSGYQAAITQSSRNENLGTDKDTGATVGAMVAKVISPRSDPYARIPVSDDRFAMQNLH